MTVSRSPIRVVHRRKVVRERGDHGSGGVGEELAGREVRERLVLEVADREFHHGVRRSARTSFASISGVGCLRSHDRFPLGHSTDRASGLATKG